MHSCSRKVKILNPGFGPRFENSAVELLKIQYGVLLSGIFPWWRGGALKASALDIYSGANKFHIEVERRRIIAYTFDHDFIRL